MNPTRLIHDLRELGITLLVRNGKLHARADEALLTPPVLDLLAAHRSCLLAAVGGRAVCSAEVGIVYDPRGGVRCERAADLRRLALERAGQLARPYPQMQFEVAGVNVEAGLQAWRTFCRTVPADAVAEALLVMDDGASVEAAEARAVSMLFSDERTWGRRPGVAAGTLNTCPPTSPHVASAAVTPSTVPPPPAAARVADVGESEPPHFDWEAARAH